MGGIVSALFGGGSKAPTISMAPVDDSAAVKEAARKQRIAAASARGRASTLLTGGGGVTGSANTKRKTLLGQ